jgi:hypothetical protein
MYRVEACAGQTSRPGGRHGPTAFSARARAIAEDHPQDAGAFGAAGLCEVPIRPSNRSASHRIRDRQHYGMPIAIFSESAATISAAVNAVVYGVKSFQKTGADGLNRSVKKSRSPLARLAHQCGSTFFEEELQQIRIADPKLWQEKSRFKCITPPGPPRLSSTNSGVSTFRSVLANGPESAKCLRAVADPLRPP